MSTAKKQKVSIGGDVTYFKPNELDEGQTVSGKYIGTRRDSYGNLCHRLELEDGTEGVVNGTGQLNKLMERVARGASVDITYNGKVTIEKGPQKGKKAHAFDVEADQILSLSAAANTNSGADSSGEDGPVF